MDRKNKDSQIGQTSSKHGCRGLKQASQLRFQEFEAHHRFNPVHLGKLYLLWILSAINLVFAASSDQYTASVSTMVRIKEVPLSK
jgi:hypothetical protein